MGARSVASAMVFLALLAGSTGFSRAQDASYELPDSQPEAVVVMPYQSVSALAVADDGTLVWAKLTGPIYRLDPDASERRILFEPNVTVGPEWGLTGIALAPDFSTTGTIFVAYITGEPGTNVTSPEARGTMHIARVTDGNETPIYTYNATRSHNSGRLLVHENLLYVTNGDHKQYDRLHDPGAEEGKILRMTLEGLPAPGNPHETDPAWHPYAFTMGHRNPFGLTWDAGREVLVESEVGNHSHEEINILQAGGNYGWPDCQGRCEPPHPGYIDPILVYPKVVTPVGVAVIGSDYYVATYNRGEIRRTFETPDGWRDEIIYVHDQGLLSIAAAPNGRGVYFGAWNGLYILSLDAPAPAVDDFTLAPVTPPATPSSETAAQSNPSPTPDSAAPTPGPATVLVLAASTAAAVLTRHRPR